MQVVKSNDDGKIYVVRANLLDRKKIRGSNALQRAHSWARRNVHGAYSIYSYPERVDENKSLGS